MAVGRFGGLDVGFNNAGSMGEMGPTPDLSLSGWKDTIETNLTSAFLGAKYQIPAMLGRGGGSLIFTSSFVGYTAGMPGTAAYAAGKAGVIGLVKALAVEFGSKAIRVNAILPGGTDKHGIIFHGNAMIESASPDRRRILVPLDFSELARVALKTAWHVANCVRRSCCFTTCLASTDERPKIRRHYSTCFV